jgi:predicted transcriptional regulator of viral defense system
VWASRRNGSADGRQRQRGPTRVDQNAAGFETHVIEGVPVKVTTAARTVADCFKYRNKIWLDVALEALREYRRSRRSVDDLTRAAGAVRVANVMRPCLEAIVS